MSLINVATAVLISLGLFFMLAASVGLVRFPDTHSRLHALTKADNLGLGLVLLGIMLQQDSAWMVGKLILLWLATLLSSATNCFLLARRARAGQGEDLS